MAANFNSPTIGVLLSGGLDSSILVAKFLKDGRRVQPFYIRTGVTWELSELNAVHRLLAALAGPNLGTLVTLDIPLRDIYHGHWSVTGTNVPNAVSPDEAVYLPGRNALLLVKPAIWCQLQGIVELALAPLGTSPFGDASAEFVERFESAINCGAASPVRVLLPFANMNKRSVMQLGRDCPLEHTFSCISPIDGIHCGRCNKCAERQQAFKQAEMPDPTRYRFTPS